MPNTQFYYNYPPGMFRPDPVAVPVVRRERLIARITGPDARKITVVTAPLGYGKTLLLTQVFQTLVEQGRQCLWLSVKGAGYEVGLIEFLWAAADRAGIPDIEDAPITVSGFLARIERSIEPVSIVIDGFDHTMQDTANTPFRQLIESAPPETSFVIATATEPQIPAVRYEASGLLRRIGAADLAFDDNDIEILGRETGFTAWLHALNARVEGWPAIVQLALGRARERPDETAPPLSGCEHDVARFLEQEVLCNLDATTFARLLDASVVDQVCGSLLDALSGEGDGVMTLEALIACGVPVRESRNREWFRLHPLVREYLYDRLQRHDHGRLTLLHQRAALWLLSFGEEQSALRHGTASGDINFLRTIYQSCRVTQMPPPAAAAGSIVGTRPLIASDAASEPKWREIFNLIQAGQLDQARRAVAEAHRRQASDFGGSDPSDTGPIEWELIYSDLLLRVFDDRLPRPDTLEALRDRLMRTPGVPPSVAAAVSELVIVSRFRRGDLSGLAEVDPDLWHASTLAPTQSKIYVLMELGIAALELGDLDLASRYMKNAKALAIAAFGPDTPHAHAASTLLAEVALERGDLVKSTEMLEKSFPNMKQGEIWFNLAASAFTTGAVAAAHRSWNDALQALELPQALATHVGLWRLPPLLIAQRLRLAVIWGEDLEAARKDRARLSSIGLLDLGELDSAGFGWRVSVPAQLAVIRFDLADRKAEAALARALALKPILEARGHVRRLIELKLLQGRASVATGDHAAGYALVRSALQSSVTSGMVHSFIDEIRFLDTLVSDLLLDDTLTDKERAFLTLQGTRLARPSIRPTRYVANGRTFDLSSREAQLLRALTTGKTFKEISFALNISINTTKMHRTRLYRKLGCNSRSHAIALAQELGAS